MRIKDILSSKKTSILNRWYESVAADSPIGVSGSADCLGKRKDNPAGETLYNGLKDLYEEFTGKADAVRLNTFMDNIIRVRAIQGMPPSKAVSFMFSLKRLIREEAADSTLDRQAFEELYSLEARIDELINVSFDVYVKCREKLYELKANEMKQWTYRALHKTGMYREMKAEE